MDCLEIKSGDSIFLKFKVFLHPTGMGHIFKQKKDNIFLSKLTLVKMWEPLGEFEAKEDDD